MQLLDRLRDLFTASEEPAPVQEPASPLPSRAYESPPQGRRKRRVPDHIEKYYIPTAVLQETQQYVEEHGNRDHECYVFWAGSIAGDEAYVSTCVYPQVESRHGGVKVPLEKMTEINRELRARDQILLAQVHSHPGRARHSPVDEEKAVSFHEGFVSIVIPDFGATPVHDLRDCGVYTYTRDSGWQLLDDDEVVDRFVIEDTVVEV